MANEFICPETGRDVSRKNILVYANHLWGVTEHNYGRLSGEARVRYLALVRMHEKKTGTKVLAGENK